MFIFAHLGIGTQLAKIRKKQLPLTGIYLGALGPDLIDKPLYYGSRWLGETAKPWTDWITCTRTLGHTALFWLSIFLMSKYISGISTTKRRLLQAMVVGAMTHLFLDLLSDAYFYHIRTLNSEVEPSSLVALLYPLYLSHFSPMPFEAFLQHGASLINPFTLFAEILGIYFLISERFKPDNEST